MVENEMRFELIHADCNDVLPMMPDDYVDLVVTSPPYNMNLRVRNGKHCSRQLVKEISTKYEGFDDNLNMLDYFEFNKTVLTHLVRVSPLVFYNVQFLTGNKSALFKIIGEFSDLIKEVIVWDKINAQPAIGKSILNSQFEVILVLDKHNSISRRFDVCNFDRGTLSNLWSIKRGKKYCKTHGAIFPEELVCKIISNFSNEGDVILDPFMGTGTTGAVCKMTKRGFIGIELLDSYFNYSCDRLKTK